LLSAIFPRKTKMDERRERVRELILTLTAAQEQIRSLWIEEEHALDSSSELPIEKKPGQILEEEKESLGLAATALNLVINKLEDILAKS
jgi:hypothetical protein